MTIKYADRVQETSATSGSGNLVLDGAVAAFRAINTVFDNDFDATALNFDYVIESAVNNTFEIGTGKLATSTLMERTTVTQNSDENTSKINFVTGGLVITVTPSRDTLANLEVDTLITDTINESTSAAGVTVDGVLLKDNEVSVDVINEKTPAAGVTIDSVLLKDNTIEVTSLSLNAGTDVITEMRTQDSYTAVATPGTSGSLPLLSTADLLRITVINDDVWVTGTIRFDTATAPLGSLSISLPFTAATLSERPDNGTAVMYRSLGSALGTAGSLYMIIGEGATDLLIVEMTTTDILNDVANHITGNTELQFDFHYTKA